MFYKVRIIATLITVTVFLVTAASTKPLKPQTICPAMGGKITKSVYVDQSGKRMYLCCEGCRSDVEKNFAQYEAKLAKKGQGLEKIPVAQNDTANAQH